MIWLLSLFICDLGQCSRFEHVFTAVRKNILRHITVNNVFIPLFSNFLNYSLRSLDFTKFYWIWCCVRFLIWCASILLSVFRPAKRVLWQHKRNAPRNRQLRIASKSYEPSLDQWSEKWKRFGLQLWQTFENRQFCEAQPNWKLVKEHRLTVSSDWKEQLGLHPEANYNYHYSAHMKWVHNCEILIRGVTCANPSQKKFFFLRLLTCI